MQKCTKDNSFCCLPQCCLEAHHKFLTSAKHREFSSSSSQEICQGQGHCSTRKMNILIKNSLANASTGNYSKIWGVIFLVGVLNESSIYFVYCVKALRQWHKPIYFLNGYFLIPHKLWMYPKENVHVPVQRGSLFRSQQKWSLILLKYIFSDFSMTGKLYTSTYVASKASFYPEILLLQG